MASNSIDDEKPNLRPTKYNAANGKTLFLHHNPNQPSNNAYIHATWENVDQQQEQSVHNNQDPFGIQQPHVPYSLNKQHRWEILNDFHKRTTNLSTSSSEDELDTQSDPEQSQKRRNIRKTNINSRQIKYRLYEFHNINQTPRCIGKTTSSKQKRTKTPRKTYMNESVNQITKLESNPENNNVESNENPTNQAAPNVTYIAIVPAPKEKHLNNIKKKYNSKNKKTRSHTQRTKVDQTNPRHDDVEPSEREEGARSSEGYDDDDDDDEFIESYYTRSKPIRIELSDFITNEPENKNRKTSIKSESSDDVESPQPKKKFYRQISREERLYNRDLTEYLKTQPATTTEQNQPKQKSLHYIMPLLYQTAYIQTNDLTFEHLSKVYGKKFLHAQCYPTTYLICLTDHLKLFKWPDKYNLFSLYAALDCYLVIVLNEPLNTEAKNCQVKVAVNMDSYADHIKIPRLSTSNKVGYKIDELIDEIIKYLTELSFQTFKPIDVEISQRKYYKNKDDNQLSDTEFINKQIQQIHILDKKDSQAELNSQELSDEKNLTRPDICTLCCGDMNQSTPMTALKSCGHWLCNECWKQYIETSIKTIRVIRCPEWNCHSLIDIGTMLSLVNIRCMKIYERNLEKSLVNLSRSYIKCPLRSCSLIVEVIDSEMDFVRCRCGHQFCMDCKQEPHFPARCSSYREYIEELRRNGDLASDHDAKVLVRGRNCVSCHNFIEKNGGCNHMTCRCGAEFCWLCTGYWKDHYSSSGAFQCPRPLIPLQKKLITKERNPSRRLYEHALFHRYERAFQNQMKLNENVKRLIGTIPLEKSPSFDPSTLQSQIDKREALLQHSFEMVKYLNYLHRICECIAVASDGYANNPIEFSNSLYPLESIIFNMTQLFEVGRGYQAIEQLNHLHERSEKLVERLRYSVSSRKIREIGYMSS